MTQTRSVEWLLACMMVAWGVGLLLPGDSLSLPQYHMLGLIAPEIIWATWSICVGALRCLFLYINGAWRRTPLIRISCAILGMMWWGLLAYLFIASIDQEHPIPAGIMWFPVFVVFEGYSAVRSARDAYHARSFEWQ